MPNHQAGYHTRNEILSQPDVLQSTLAIIQINASMLSGLFDLGKYQSIVLTGCGSPYYMGLSLAPLLQRLTGKPTRAVPASELWFSPDAYFIPDKKHLLVALSRSGATTETLRACARFQQEKRGDILTFSCYPDAELATVGAINLLFPEAQEESVAQTRAFSALYLAAVAAAHLMARQDKAFAQMAAIPNVVQQILDRSAVLAKALGSDLSLDRFYFLGSGTRYGLACELSLKMKEMTLSHSEPFHFMEFRHGPMSMVAPSSLIVALLSQSNYKRELAVVNEMRQMGAGVVTIGEQAADVSFGAGLDEELSDVLYLPFGQMMALERSLAKGLNPDRPEKLVAFVKLDE